MAKFGHAVRCRSCGEVIYTLTSRAEVLCSTCYLAPTPLLLGMEEGQAEFGIAPTLFASPPRRLCPRCQTREIRMRKAEHCRACTMQLLGEKRYAENTHCGRGHEWTDETTRWTARGKRQCIPCHNERRRTKAAKAASAKYQRAWRAKQKRAEESTKETQCLADSEYPFGADDELTTAVAAAFIRLPDDIRGEACQMALLDVLEGTLALEQVRERVDEYARKAFRATRGPYRALSLNGHDRFGRPLEETLRP